MCVPKLTSCQVIAHEYGDFFIADNRFTSLHALVQHYYNTFLCDNMALSRPIKPVVPVSVRAARPVPSPCLMRPRMSPSSARPAPPSTTMPARDHTS